jgi:hypothetical protein
MVSEVSVHHGRVWQSRVAYIMEARRQREIETERQRERDRERERRRKRERRAERRDCLCYLAFLLTFGVGLPL